MAVHLMVVRKLSERKEPGTRYKTFKDTLPMIYFLRPHLLNFPPPPKTVPSAGDQEFNTQPFLGGHFIPKPQQTMIKDITKGQG
jgi:hypothetical protein